MVMAMCGAQLKDRNRSTDFKETIDQLAMASIVLVGIVMCCGERMVMT